MTRLAPNTLALTVTTILILSIASLAQAACSGSGGGSRSSYTSSNYVSSKIVRSPAKTCTGPTCSKKNTQPVENTVDDQELAASVAAERDYEINTTVKAEDAVSSPSDLSDTTPTTATAKTVSHATTEKTSPAPVVNVKYLVVQEAKPGTGLDVNDKTNPAVNRGTFDTLASAQETAEIWRDVMPGWEVEVVEVAMNK